ncbi:hypothetical protein KL905_002380, partial [Ogataea polymorpha]
ENRRYCFHREDINCSALEILELSQAGRSKSSQNQRRPCPLRTAINRSQYMNRNICMSGNKFWDRCNSSGFCHCGTWVCELSKFADVLSPW